MQDLLETLRSASRDGADPFVVELVFPENTSPADISDRIEQALPGAAAQVESAFGEEQDQFFFAEFSGTNVAGLEATAFEFARRLRAALDAIEANPVLPESLYGAVAVGAVTTEAGLFNCSTPRTNIRPFGWVHKVIRTPQAWQRSRGAGSTVAVIDTGYSSHGELQGALDLTHQLNLVEGGTDASDRFSDGPLRNPGHGTLVTSVIASRGSADMNGNTGQPGAVTGSAPEAKVMPIRAIKSVINLDQRTLPHAIAHAINNGADVITMAQGGPGRVASTERALRQAVQRGLVVVCAAGNCWPNVVFPAAYAANGLCTALAAVTKSLRPWARSGRGPEVTLSAPGENVWGAAKRKPDDHDWGIKASQGTTLATSLTAGVAALWVARHGGRTALRHKAAAAGTTVQAMWIASVTHGLSKPPVWGGANDLGAGVLDAKSTLDAPLPQSLTGHEAVAESDLGPAGIESSANILLTHLANHAPAAAAEFSSDLADYASELLWLSHRTGARARAAETLGVEAALVPDATSHGLGAILADKPALRAAVGAD
ncbi:S8 family serine peptidase [Ruegeria sp. HKCCD8929]|uniref:S8 family serine peptidase n=1 Tax=Ruegeria sp. HKCCD8929 TaxID=2683006 RepID=UPI0014877836|nr:S8 family serine peptidase [Ruegeria sp. HKCCD8929]